MRTDILSVMGRRLGRRVSVRADGRLSPKGLRERCGELQDKAQAILDRAEQGGRDLTDEEKVEFDALVAEHKKVRADLGRAEWLEAEEDREAEAEINRRIGARGAMRSSAGALTDLAGRWNSAPPMATSGPDGQPIYCLSPGQRFVDLPGSDRFGDIPHAFGQCLVAAVTGRWNRLPRELKNAMQENSNSTGGILVPEEVARRIIDLARARSVVIRAGAWTQPMTTDRAVIARVASDPSFETHAENESITESDIGFDGVGLTARTIATLCRASRELVEDATNMSAIIETTIVRALAAELDRQMLAGSGSAEMTGILNDSGIGSTTAVGAPAWADLLTALADIEGNNHTPTSYICSPTISNDLNALTSGDGSNSAALWQGPPPGVDKLERFVTSNMPDTDILMGDFTRVILGLRQDALVEFTSTGGDAFAKHSVLFKVTWRGDVAIEDGGAFHDLAGITT